MKVVGRFEIQDVINAGVVETFTARDPGKGQTVLLHLMPVGLSGPPEEHFLTFAPGCPGKVLESGVDEATQRSFVVTEYPRDRKALLLWIKQLTSLSAPPAPPLAPAAPAGQNAPGGATRMFDPSAIFGAAPAAAAPAPVPDGGAGGATRMFDPSAIFGAPATPTAPPAKAAPPPPPAGTPPSGAGGATRMFDPAAIFGAAPPAASQSAASPEPATPPAAAQKSGPEGATRMFDPAAIFGAAAGPVSAPPKAEPPPAAAAAQPAAPKREPGEFTRRFEREAIRRAIEANKAMAARATQQRSTPLTPPAETAPRPGEKKQGPFTGLLDAYGQRLDATVPQPAAKPPQPAEPAKTVSPETPSGTAPGGAAAKPPAKPATGPAPAPWPKPTAKPASASASAPAPKTPPAHPVPVEEPGRSLSPGLMLGVLAVLAILIVLFFLLRK